MAPVIAMQPDALIMADPGLDGRWWETWPDMPVHLSVQANTVNYSAGGEVLGRSWACRIIPSRELSLDEVEEIRQQCPDIELEVFCARRAVHCLPGRCLLSGYFNHRDPNQGTCTNACRWDYQVHEASEGSDSGDAQRIDLISAGAGQRQPAVCRLWRRRAPSAGQ